MAQEEIIFKLGVDTGDSVQDVNKVSDAIEEVGKDAKKSEGSFVNLRKELKTLTIQLQNLDPASKEFETVAKRAGQIKEQMRGVADAINDADPEKFGGKFQRTAEGIAGAFSAVTGAQALFGQQSEEIEKQMLKVQGAIALTQGISAMKELRNDATDLAGSIKNKVVTAFQSLNASQIANAQATGTMTTLQKAYNVVVGSSTGALKGFKLALASTGIGALILALGYLITNFDKLKGSMSAGLTSAKNLETSTNRQAKAARDASDNFAEYERTLKRLGYTEDEIYDKRQARFKDAIDKTKKEIEASEKVYKEQLKNLKIVEGFDKWGLNATGRLLFGDEETAKEQQQKVKDLRETLTKLRNDQYEAQQQAKADRLKDAEDEKAKQKEIDDASAAKRKENYQKYLEEIHQNNLKQLELKNQQLAEQEKLENEYYDSFKNQQQLEEQAVRDKYFNIIQTTKENETLLLAQQKELDAIALKYKEEQDQIERDRKNNIANQEEEFMNSYYDAITNSVQKEKDAINEKYFYLIEKAKEYGLETTELERQRTEELAKYDKIQAESKKELANAIGGIFGELAGLSKQASGIQKAFAITQVAIDTATALSGLTSISFSPTNGDNIINPLGPYIKLATGTAKIISNMARVKSILGSGVTVTPPTIGGANANLGSGANTQQGTTQTVQAQSTYKVVVVDSDITKMQDKTKKVQAISTI